jgi:hypothetical protein
MLGSMAPKIDGNSCLIGYTGFVGQTLTSQRRFAGLYNSANVDELPGQSYSTVICAAAPALMWAANENPAPDKHNLLRIAEIVKKVKCDRVVLISTIAVFDDPSRGYTESSACYQIQKAYGRHRHELEVDLSEHFSRCHIMRLPALFGKGIKKNFIFDLLNPVPSFIRPTKFVELARICDPETVALLRTVYAYADHIAMWVVDRSALDSAGLRSKLERALAEIGFVARTFTNSASRFQYYNIDHLAADIEWVIEQEIPVLNVCSHPLEAAEVCQALTGFDFVNVGPAIILEDVRSDHARRYGRDDHYLYDSATVLADLKAFYDREKA